MNGNRYRAVKGSKFGRLKAAVEDYRTGETIRVATDALAYYLANRLNALEAGEPLPVPGPQHYPSRFQVAHDPAFPTPGAAVFYVHRMATALVAAAPRDEVAQSIAKLLNRADYPLIERPARFPWSPTLTEVGVLEWPPEDFPPPSLEGGGPHRSRSLRARVAAFAIVCLLPLAAVGVLVALAVGWPIVVSMIGLNVVVIGITMARAGR